MEEEEEEKEEEEEEEEEIVTKARLFHSSLRRTFSYVKVSCALWKGVREESRNRGVILNQTSRNKGCCDLKGPWDHFRVFNSCIKKEEEKKKLHES